MVSINLRLHAEVHRSWLSISFEVNEKSQNTWFAFAQWQMHMNSFGLSGLVYAATLDDLPQDYFEPTLNCRT